MCTLILIREPGLLRVGANRDERLDRPAGPPRRWTFGPRAGLAPVDLEAGGTWIGVNDRGVFAALTNRFGVPERAEAPSRGRWVPQMLAHGSAGEAAQFLREARVLENGFHLVVADLDTAFEAVHDGESLELTALGWGPTIVTERSHGAAPAPREARITRELAARGTDLDALTQVLAQTDPESPLDGVRVFSREHDYGTRSSTRIELTRAGLRFEFAERYPNDTGYRDFTLV